MERLRGAIVFIGVRTLKSQTPAESPQYPVRRRAESKPDMRPMLWERNDVIHSKCRDMSAIPINSQWCENENEMLVIYRIYRHALLFRTYCV